MLQDIVEVQPASKYNLHLRFEDGVEGEANIAEMISFNGVFEPLKNPEYFTQVRVNTELGTIAWPNGADLDPDVLYAAVSGYYLPVYKITSP